MTDGLAITLPCNEQSLSTACCTGIGRNGPLK
jgi:hypothetical protein